MPVNIRHRESPSILNLSDMEAPDQNPTPAQSLKSFDYGVWRVVYENSLGKPTSWIQDFFHHAQTIRDAPIVRFFSDVYSVDPYGTAICILSRCFAAIEQSLPIFLYAKLLSLVSHFCYKLPYDCYSHEVSVRTWLLERCV